MDLNEIEARVGISAALARFINVSDTGRVDQAIEHGFAEDAAYELPNGRRAVGKSAIVKLLGAASEAQLSGRNAPKYVRHHVTLSRVEMTDRNGATADTHFVAFTEKGVDHWGRWIDKFHRHEDGRWLFRERLVWIEGVAEFSWMHAGGLT
jgi:hypothetical protein